jgi:glycogen operon protein
VRDFWRGEPATLGEFAFRLTGSSDLYQADTRHPGASVNFVTVHDGFTLRDLVSYNEKHNEANGEGGADGESYNRSWNCGVEGDTDDAAVLALRRRQRRNFLATLLLSQGVTMLLGGDESGHTQRGNNNAYCQDNEISWYDWDRVDADLLEFTRRLIALRREHPVLRRRRWFQGRSIRGSVDLGWCRPDGAEMGDDDCDAGSAASVGMFLNGDAITYRDRRGQRVIDDSFLLLFNAHSEAIDWTLPKQWGGSWELVVDTDPSDSPGREGAAVDGAATLPVPGRSVVVLRRLDAVGLRGDPLASSG